MTCSVQKRRHQHETKQVEENFQYPQDMNLEISSRNWPCQRRGHAVVILMFQDGMQCKVCLCIATSQQISSWLQWGQSSKNQEPAFHLALQRQRDAGSDIIRRMGGVKGCGITFCKRFCEYLMISGEHCASDMFGHGAQ